jgi:hypothetical protein
VLVWQLPVNVVYNDANQVLFMAIEFIKAQQEADRQRVAAGGQPSMFNR